jgi:hypothetical protein
MTLLSILVILHVAGGFAYGLSSTNRAESALSSTKSMHELLHDGTSWDMSRKKAEAIESKMMRKEKQQILETAPEVKLHRFAEVSSQEVKSHSSQGQRVRRPVYGESLPAPATQEALIEMESRLQSSTTTCIEAHVSSGCQSKGGDCQHVFFPEFQRCASCVEDVPITFATFSTLGRAAEWCEEAPYLPIGDGWCRPGDCEVANTTAAECDKHVNGFFQGRLQCG